MAARPRIVPAVLAIVIAVFLGTGALTVAGRRGDDAGPRRVDASMAAALEELEAFVESARGLRFVHPVDVSVLGDAAFRRALSGGRPVEAFKAGVEDGLLRALGLVKAGDDLGGVGHIDADTVAGFYDTETNELVVRGRRLTPFVRQVLVHELTHALDEQHFNLDPDLDDDEAALAFDALVEGDAVNVENRYVASLTEAERRQARDEEEATFGGVDSGRVPTIFGDLGDFPYVDGPDLVAALIAAGGQARVDAAFRSPPTTSAEVLHPARFLAGKGRAGVGRVDAGGRVLDEGVVGELVLQRVLAESSPEAVAAKAAEGWAGDRYVAWRNGKQICVRSRVVLDSEAEATELLTALRQWAGDHPGATIDGSASAVTFSRCG